MNHIIHIFGPSGAGTSTLGRKICAELGYHFMDTDDYFWLPTDPQFTTPRPVEERLRLMREEIKREQDVVISGSLVDWGDVLIPLFTLAIRVETDAQVRLRRLKAREQANFGSRVEPGGDLYEKHQAFLQWAMAYDAGGLDMRSRAKHDQWQMLLKCPLLEVDGAGDLERNFALVKAYVQDQEVRK